MFVLLECHSNFPIPWKLFRQLLDHLLPTEPIQAQQLIDRLLDKIRFENEAQFLFEWHQLNNYSIKFIGLMKIFNSLLTSLIKHIKFHQYSSNFTGIFCSSTTWIFDLKLKTVQNIFTISHTFQIRLTITTSRACWKSCRASCGFDGSKIFAALSKLEAALSGLPC